jgi:glycosyltransferase involved in cell wall biosynthesis
VTSLPNKVLKILIIPRPLPKALVENGLDRYLDALLSGMAGRVEYIGVDDPQFPRGSARKVKSDLPVNPVKPRFRIMGLFPKPFRRLLGYARDIWQLSRLLRPYRRQVDLIHVNRVGCEIHPIAARLAGFKRIVTTIHNLPGEAEKDSWVCRLVERFSFACGDVHIAVSEATFEAWHARVGLKKVVELSGCQVVKGEADGSITHRGKCITIYNGMDPVDLTGFDRRAYRQQFCDDPEHVFIIGICARLHRMKGHVVLLEAFASLLKEQLLGCSVDKLLSNYPEVSPSITTQQPNNPTTIPLLLIAGSGPERPNLEAKIAELGIGNHVRLLGHRTDAERFAASLDLNVLPSVELESFGYSVVEAMFAGVPSIVSDVGGMKELVAASGGGIILRAGDVSALVQAIEFYINNPAERKQAGEQAQTYARRELGAGRMASATLKTYFAVADNV